MQWVVEWYNLLIVHHTHRKSFTHSFAQTMFQAMMLLARLMMVIKRIQLAHTKVVRTVSHKNELNCGYQSCAYVVLTLSHTKMSAIVVKSKWFMLHTLLHYFKNSRYDGRQNDTTCTNLQFHTKRSAVSVMTVVKM